MSDHSESSLADNISFFVMLISSAVLLFGLGFAACYYEFFPHGFLESAKEGFEEVKKEVSDELPWWAQEVDESRNYPIQNSAEAYQGLNLISRVSGWENLSVDVTDMDGSIVQSWDIDWDRLWSDAWHLPKEVIPKEKPGTHVDGAAILENGDLVFNFEHLGMVRLDPSGKVVWRLAYQTHHSIELNDGYIWACGQRREIYGNVNYPDRDPPFDAYTILKISLDGKIVKEWSVADLLTKNGLGGLLSFEYQPIRDKSPLHRNDRLHLNDVEPFPVGMAEGFFKKGDVFVSLKNVNTVFVFNENTGKIKYTSTGRFTLQHDPDFIDGNTFSIFDNKFVENGEYVSRVVIVSADQDRYETYFKGSDAVPFYTEFMGEHQWLPNGNLLLTESLHGRAIEVNKKGEVVWEYRNILKPGIVALLEEVRRLPLRYRALWDK